QPLPGVEDEDLPVALAQRRQRDADVVVGDGRQRGVTVLVARVGELVHGDGEELAAVVGEDEAGRAVEPGQRGVRGDVLASSPRGGEDVGGEVLDVRGGRTPPEVAVHGGRVGTVELLEPRIVAHSAPLVRCHHPACVPGGPDLARARPGQTNAPRDVSPAGRQEPVYLKASLTFSAACLRLPLVWSFWPSAWRSLLSVASPTASLILPEVFSVEFAILSSAPMGQLLPSRRPVVASLPPTLGVARAGRTGRAGHRRPGPGRTTARHRRTVAGCSGVRNQ